MTDQNALIAEWLYCKDVERKAQARRREVEDDLVKEFAFDATNEHTQTIKKGNETIKISGRLDRKVDAVKVQELASEYGIESHMSILFRWSPEINMAVWKATDERITAALAPAITIKPGRPSFSITTKE